MVTAMGKAKVRNQKREVQRITKGLIDGGLKVGPIKFDPVTGQLIFNTVDPEGEQCAIT